MALNRAEEGKNKNIRFYILFLVLFILSVICSFFNYKLTFLPRSAPSLDNSTYDSIIDHTKLLKLLKNKNIKYK